MIDALQELEELAIIMNEDVEDVEETVVYCYLAIRLKPLIGHYDTTEEDINRMCEALANNYFNYDFSLDAMVTAVYNYYKTAKKQPSIEMLITNIDTLFEISEKE